MTIKKLRQFMLDSGIDYLLVNSTNKFLVEYNSLEENSRYKLTGFSGSTGDALLSLDNCFLFVDGRYHIQADLETDADIVTVVKLQSGDTFLSKIIDNIKNNSILGVFSEKNSISRIDSINRELKKKNSRIKFLDVDPLDIEIGYKNRKIENISLSCAGKSVADKLKEISENLDDNSVFCITNLEEVSYVCNLRCFSVPFSSQIFGKLLVLKNSALLFSDENLPNDLPIQLKKCSEFKKFIESHSDLNFIVDKTSINAYDTFLLGDRVEFVNNSPVKLLKSIKNNAEIEHYKSAFAATDRTMYAIRDFINNNDNLSEFDIVNQLEREFYRNGAKNLSFKSIVAKDKNSALAHYSKSSATEIIENGSLILIDCGAYYDGGLATDITRVFVKGEPSNLQKRVYTIVLKMFLNAFNFVANPVVGFDVDNLARRIYAQNEIDGFVFNHGLGHGIGVSVHEIPPNLSKNDIAKTQIKDNMCFTIEPGLYCESCFGIRLENSCYLENGNIKSFTNMCYEEKLIDYSLLTAQETEWLKKFEVL